mgnify:FL=1
MDYAFNRKFGIEIEAYNCSRERLARELREVGIEVTVESYNHTTRPHWKLVTDSSISGNDTFELVSPILVGEAGLRELEKVCWVLDLCDVKVNGSCGLHVHIDAAGFSMETWRNLALSYKHLEPVIDKFMPASRRDNYYCKGLGHVSDEMIRSAPDGGRAEKQNRQPLPQGEPRSLFTAQDGRVPPAFGNDQLHKNA